MDLKEVLNEVPLVKNVERIEKIELDHPEAKNHIYVLFFQGHLNEDTIIKIRKQWNSIFNKYPPKLLILDGNTDIKRL